MCAALGWASYIGWYGWVRGVVCLYLFYLSFIYIRYGLNHFTGVLKELGVTAPFYLVLVKEGNVVSVHLSFYILSIILSLSTYVT